jgi:hypothetical protein
VQQSLLENALCLIGFSGDDPNFLAWIGWIRDNIGTEHSSKLYFIGIDQIAPVDRMIFDQRHIVYIDASKVAKKDSPAIKIEAVLDYLASKEDRGGGIYWSTTHADLYPRIEKSTDKKNQLQEVVSQWEKTRKAYPGWCIAPESLRTSIWTYTGEWVAELKRDKPIPASLDFDFLYELNWRLERCLYPLFDDAATALRDCLSRYWLFAGSNPLSRSTDLLHNPALEQGYDSLRERWCTLALSILRYYREEGLSEDWKLFATILKDHEDCLSGEQRASFAYERCLYCLFEVDIEGLDREFGNWPENLSLPFWEAKRAGLLAERGHMDEAVKILDRSLADIRAKQNLKPTSSDFTLMSQEAYVMVLRRYVGEASDLDRYDHHEEKSATTDYSARWNELKQYLCDPWEELSAFEQKLEPAPALRQRITTKYGFDIGSASRTRHLFNGPDTQVLDGYSFLRFLEETAIPVSLPFMNFGKKAAIGALPRIAPYSSHWALCEAARIGDPEIADQLFDRRALAHLDRTTVDNYVSHYLQTARRIGGSSERATGRYQTSLDNYATKAIPEILSRLCCKSSPESRKNILSFIEDIYRAENKAPYSGVDHLVERLIESASWEELDTYIPRFLTLAIPQETHPMIENQFINPMSAILDSEYTFKGKRHQIVVEHSAVERLLANATDQNEKTRAWFIASLFALKELAVLDEKQDKELGKLIWADASDRLPEHSGFFKFAFLDLTIPEGVDAQGMFKKYLFETPLPVIGDIRKGVSLAGGNFPIIADLLGSAKYLEWTDSETHALLDKLISWWDSDKQYLGVETTPKDSAGFGSIPEEARARLAKLPDIMAHVIAPHIREGSTNDDLKRIARLIEEARAADVPYLKMELAFTSLFPEEHSRLIGEMAEALSSSRRETIVDALKAVLFSLDDPCGSAPLTPEELGHLLVEVSDIVRWRYGPGLVSAMNTIGQFIKRRPECFDRRIEAGVLVGLKELVHETDPTALEPTDLSRKLEMRQSAAALSFILFERYRSAAQGIPEAIRVWETLCASSDEFAEIRKKWINVLDKVTDAMKVKT